MEVPTSGEFKLELMLLRFDKLGLVSLASIKKTVFVIIVLLASSRLKPNALPSNPVNQKTLKCGCSEELKGRLKLSRH